MILGKPAPYRPSDLPWDEAPAGDWFQWDRDARLDLDEVLAGARRAGEITKFSFEPPSLTDLFLEAVSEGRSG